MKLFNRAKRIAAVTAASVILVSGASVPSQAEDGAGASLIDVSRHRPPRVLPLSLQRLHRMSLQRRLLLCLRPLLLWRRCAHRQQVTGLRLRRQRVV